MAAKPFLIALLIFAALVPAAIWFLLDWLRQRGDRAIEGQLRRVERKVEELQHDFRAAGLDDYSGGPLTAAADDDQRPFRPPER